MTENINDDSIEGLLHGGYCYRLKDAGPFVISKDFQAPGPEGGTLPRINLEQSRDQLWAFVGRELSINDGGTSESAFDAAVKPLELENGVTEALSWYVSDYQHEVKTSVIRKQLLELRDAIERLKSKLPNESSAVGHFLYKTFTGEVLLEGRLKPSPAQMNALEDDWRARSGFDAIQGQLDVMLHNIDAARSLLGKSRKRPPQHQVASFVRTLAETWKVVIGRWPKSGRHPDDSRQTGPFADFVRATNNLLPPPFRIRTLDRAIRAVCKATSSS